MRTQQKHVEIPGPKIIKLFSCSAMFSKKEFTIVSNLRFISRTNFMLSWVEHENFFITSGPGDPWGIKQEGQDGHCSPDYQTSFDSIGLSVKEMKIEIDFQDGSRGGHLGFPIRMLLAIFDLQVAPILPIKFGVNWFFGLRRKISS